MCDLGSRFGYGECFHHRFYGDIGGGRCAEWARDTLPDENVQHVKAAAPSVYITTLDTCNICLSCLVGPICLDRHPTCLCRLCSPGLTLPIILVGAAHRLAIDRSAPPPGYIRGHISRTIKWSLLPYFLYHTQHVRIGDQLHLF